MTTRFPLVPLVALAVVLASAGCIQNMADLRDRLGASDEALGATNVDPDLTNTTNKTNVTLKPPVARITIFGANNALVYKSSFVAEDVTDPIFVDPEVTLTLNAGDSETRAPGATLVKYAWDVVGERSEGIKTEASFVDAGMYHVMLTVTDSQGATDVQMLMLAIAPKPFTVERTLQTGPIAGALGSGQDGRAAFTLSAEDAEVPATIRSVSVSAPATDSCDAVISLLDADGKAVARADKGGVGAAETATLDAPPEGDYEVVVGIGDACAAHEGIPVLVVVTYVPIIEGLSADDGHGGHAH